jgi:hypothetical protein
MHADDPQWRQDVIRSDGAGDMRWERWTNWQRGDPRWRVWVLETMHLTVEETVNHVARWVEECRGVRRSNPLATVAL